MRMLVACEESQVVTKAFRLKGHEAYSCDLQETSGDNKDWHIKGDVVQLINQPWDMIIAFPPCTDLAVSGARWFKEKQADGRQQKSIDNNNNNNVLSGFNKLYLLFKYLYLCRCR